MPLSTAMRTRRMPVASSPRPMWWPPRPTIDTSIPVRPSRRLAIALIPRTMPRSGHAVKQGRPRTDSPRRRHEHGPRVVAGAVDGEEHGVVLAGKDGVEVVHLVHAPSQAVRALQPSLTGLRQVGGVRVVSQ